MWCLGGKRGKLVGGNASGDAMDEAMAGRRFCPGAVAATPGGAWVVDHELPVVAFADAQDLSIEVVGNWFEECVLHDWAPHREIVTAVVGAGDECWVASPHAGGVIRLSRG